jgi:hypothetical protein
MPAFAKATAWQTLHAKFGGADRDRTDDLYSASVALFRLSYGPKILLDKLKTNLLITKVIFIPNL